MNYREAKKEAEKFYVEDGKFDKNIFIRHNDGSTLYFTYSSYKKINEWILVATEHHGFFAYHIEDLDFMKVKVRFEDGNYNSTSECIVFASQDFIDREKD